MNPIIARQLAHAILPTLKQIRGRRYDGEDGVCFLGGLSKVCSQFEGLPHPSFFFRCAGEEGQLIQYYHTQTVLEEFFGLEDGSLDGAWEDNDHSDMSFETLLAEYLPLSAEPTPEESATVNALVNELTP